MTRDTPIPPSGDVPPDAIGPYKLLQVIGEGGIGIVYEAEQLDPVHRRVAIKIIKLGMDTKEVMARFEAERQALAVMNHPTIAKVLDAGHTSNGRPYFVMELVKGMPLDRYCDTNRLTTNERIELVIDICRGVQHAHQKGVIHRDLKPSNVLVTEQDGRPLPKIIDFGVAKAMGLRLADKTIVTQLGAVVGTPEYMSPEQAEASGLDVDTRTDIYSLGVILYELLVGTLPFERDAIASPAFIVRLAARETNPPSPSSRLQSLARARDMVATLRRTDVRALYRELRGDLDWIVMRAIDPERTRRYETANGLGLDLERYLRQEPVLARAPSARYRLRKFVKRNRLAVAASAVVIVTLLLGLLGTTVGFLRANRAQVVAAQETETAVQALRFIVGMFGMSDASLVAARDLTARDLLERGLLQIDSIVDNPLVKGRLLQTFGAAFTSLGEYDRADSLLQLALAVRREAFAHGNAELEASLNGDAELESGLRQLAWLYLQERRLDEALPLARQSVAIARQVLGADHLTYAAALQTLGMIERDLALYDSARVHLDRAIEIAERRVAPNHEAIGWPLFHRAWLHQLVGEYEAARAIYRRLLSVFADTTGAYHALTVETLNDLAVLLSRMGHPDSSIILTQQILDRRERALGPDHPTIALTLGNLSIQYLDRGDLEQALRHRQRAIDIKHGVAGPDHPTLVNDYFGLGDILLHSRRYREAEEALRRSLAIIDSTFGRNHPSSIWRLDRLARVYMNLGRYGDARNILERALSLVEADAQLEPGAVETTLITMGEFELIEGNPLAAGNYIRRAMTTPAGGERVEAFRVLAESLMSMGRLDSALVVLDRADQLVSGTTEEALSQTWLRIRLARVMSRQVVADSLLNAARVLIARPDNVPGRSKYNEAVFWTLNGDESRALESLSRSLELGYLTPLLALAPSLASLRDLPAFPNILARVREGVTESGGGG